jgi:hypothetical protein
MINLHGPAGTTSANQLTKLDEPNNNDAPAELNEKLTQKTCIPRKISVKSMDKIDLEKRMLASELENRTRA